MNLCPKCQQPVSESVLEGRKLIARVHASPYAIPDTGRYVTVILRTCACGELVERRYENIPGASGRAVIIR